MKLRKYLSFALLLSIQYCAFATDKALSLTFDDEGEVFKECTAVRIPGKTGKALSFSGSNYAVVESPVIVGAKVLKLEFDLFPQSEKGVILACFQEDGNKRSFLISVDDGNLFFVVDSNGTPDATSRLKMPVAMNQWSHVKAEYQPGAMMLQVNENISRGNAAMKLFTSDIPLQIGRYFAGRGMRFFKGMLDNLTIFSSDTEPPIQFASKLADVPAETVLEDWDFSKMQSMPADLDPSLGTWTIDKGILSQTARLKTERPFLLRTSGKQFDDVATDAVIRLLPGKYRRGGLGLRMACTAPGFFPERGYFFEVEDTADTRYARLFSWKRSQMKHLPDFTAPGNLYMGEPNELTLLDEERLPLSANSEMVMTFAAAGARLVGYIDGKKCVAAMRGDIDKGEAGLVAYASAVSVQRWRVRKILPEENCDLSGVQLVPADGSNANPPMLRWSESEYDVADKKADICFDLEIATDASFSKILYKAESIYEPMHRPNTGLPAGTLFWRVRRQSPRGTMIWSLPGKLTIASPTISPAVAGELSPRHFMEEKPVWTIPFKGEPDGTTFTLDGKDDALKIDCANSKWTLQPIAPLALGLHCIVRKNAVETQESYVVRLDRELPRIALRKDGVLLKDGKPFFPVGTYRDPSDTDTDFAGSQEAGFNFTHSYYFEESGRGEDVLKQDRAYLDRAGELGLNVFLACSRKEVFKYGKHLDADAGRVLREMAVRRLTSANYISCDPHEEPDGGPWGLPPRAVNRVHRLLKEIDPVHLTHTLLYLPKSFKDYSRSVDVLMIDPYPQPYDNTDFVYRNLRRASEESGKPIWAVIQAFDWRIADYAFNYKVPAAEHRPSVSELRCMTYLALAAGSKGVIFYWWRNDKAKIREDYPQIWAEICKLTKEVKELTPFLVSEDAEPECFVNADGVRSKAFSNGGKVKAIVVNTTEQTVKTSVAIGGTSPKVMQLKLKPLEVRILE